ncbi:glycosyltransferase family 2 protein [Haloarcula rubripromontorii]|uniref:glycosyltransferase family 2 protein n=1 Tax=Haloarcula rubripromontorii TaxID=1705562 RepID=UPI00345BD395
MMSEVSAIVVTLNEADQIRGCLESLQWCDEIVVVDSFSDDETVETAREYTDEIYTHEKTGYVEPIREYAIEKTSNEWILNVDADEIVPPALAERLQRIVDEDEADNVHSPRKNYMFGRWMKSGGWWPGYRQVMFKKGSVHTSDKIHAGLEPIDGAEELYIKPDESLAVVHFNYTDIHDFVSRTNRYTSIESEQREFSYLRAIINPVREFVYILVKKSGYRMGSRGVVLALLMLFYKLLVSLKTWEREQWGGEQIYEQVYDEVRREELQKWDEQRD